MRLRLARAAGGAGRGLGAGLAAGACWWLVETAANWLAGGWVPPPLLGTIAALDLGLAAAMGAVAGALLGLAGQRPGGATLALALAVGFGFLRVFAPPGIGAEAVYLLVASAAAWGAVVLARRAVGTLAFVHLTLLTTAATVLGAFALDEARGEPLAGFQLPLLFATLPLVGVAADALLGLAVRRRGVRLGLGLAAAGVAALVWGRPLDPAPVVEPLVTAVPPPAGTPDVILVSLDTTRADHLSTYGYARDTSPQLTGFAADALRFTQARSPSSWTLPGHASMLTGTYPSRHGARLAGAWLPGQSIDGRRRVAFPLPARAVTLAEALRDHGYSTGAFVANFSYLYRDFGLAQGFQHYDDAPGLLLRVRPHAVRFVQRFSPGFCLKPFRSAPEMNAAALAWLDGAPAGRPVFLFVNYMEPHQPWLAPPPHDRWSRALPAARRLARKDLYTHAVRELAGEEREFVVANYDGQVAAMDAGLGELLAALRRRGRYEGALIIVTGDHGELLGEHGQLGHIARMLYEPLLRVPMVVKFPGPTRPRGTSETPVQLVDVLPTALAAAGAPSPPDVQGEALPDVTHPSLAEEEINPFLVSRYGAVYDRAMRVVYDGTYKLIRTSRGEHLLFDLATDPDEQHDLSAREPERLSALSARLDSLFGGPVDVAAAKRN